MLFENILVAIDGSKSSQIAVESAIWLCTNLNAQLSGLYVCDAKLTDLFIDPEFGGPSSALQSREHAQKTNRILNLIGQTALQIFAAQARLSCINAGTILSEGDPSGEILSASKRYSLLVLGHRGHSLPGPIAHLPLGSVAAAVTAHAELPVLISREPLSEMRQVLVAFDGSEGSIGALLLAECLALKTHTRLKAITVTHAPADRDKALFIAERGEALLRSRSKDVFVIRTGDALETILEHAEQTKSLLLVGGYGFADPDENVLDKSTATLIEANRSNIMIYRPHGTHARAGKNTHDSRHLSAIK